MAGTAAVALQPERNSNRKIASATLAQLSTDQKNTLLLQIADALEAAAAKILRANEEDIKRSGLSGAMRDVCC